MSLEEIVLANNELGINTAFFCEDNGILGYSEGNTIYLNKYYNSDLEIVNKHEVMHFYEDSSQFNLVKKKIFEVLNASQIKKLRDLYCFKYNGLYSETEIDNGALDNEIVIDMIVGNGNFNVDLNKYYEIIISESDKENVISKKYLNLGVTTRIKQQFVELTKWEKIFVLNYYNRSDVVLPTDKFSKYKEVRNTIKKELNKLYDLVKDKNNFIIRPNSKEVLKKYERFLNKAIVNGNENEIEEIMSSKETCLIRFANMYTKILYEEYCSIVELIKNTNYEDAFKYLMLHETLSKVYSQQHSGDLTNNIVNKRILDETIKSHMMFNEFVLGIIYNNLEEYSNFANLYFAAISLLNKSTYEENGITLKDVNTFNKGKWIRFVGKFGDHTKYLKNAQKLASMVQDTPWCTKQQASLHLEEGDFYLFVDNDGKPRIGVKLIGDSIDEVRGVKNGNAQEIEEEYREVVLEFLSKNKNIKFGKEWLEKEEWNKRLVEYLKKIEDGEFNRKDIPSLIYDITEVVDYKPHYAQCGNRQELLSLIKNNRAVKKHLAKKYGCNPRKIFIGDITSNDVKKGKFNYEVVLGNVCFSCYNGPKIDFSKLRIVLGKADFSDSNVDNLDNLEIVSGSGIFSRVNIDRIDNLKMIGEVADFFEAKIKSMASLEKIGGSGAFVFSTIGDLHNLETIGEEARFEYSNINDLSGLNRVIGNAIFSHSHIDKIGDFICDGEVIGLTEKKVSESNSKNIINKR